MRARNAESRRGRQPRLRPRPKSIGGGRLPSRPSTVGDALVEKRESIGSQIDPLSLLSFEVGMRDSHDSGPPLGDMASLSSEPLSLQRGSSLQLPVSALLPTSPGLGPTQLEVVHVLRADEKPPADDNISIVLPDGSLLGASLPTNADAGHEAVVLLPGGASVQRVENKNEIYENLSWEAPVTMADKARSVSQRLSFLLEPQPLTDSKREPVTVARQETSPARDSKFLSRHVSAVLHHADDLVDSILHHILSDTASMLNSLPSERASPERDGLKLENALPKPEALPKVDAPTGRVCAVEAQALPKADVPDFQIRAAEDKLRQFEMELSLRYAMRAPCPGSDIPTAIDGLCGPHHESSLFGRPALTCPEPRRKNTGRNVSAISTLQGRVHNDMHPVALSRDRIQEIENYRTRFAHHCLASREAGIDRSSAGDAISVATWTIWPHLADTIALAAVESAIEDVHEALERHVEELVTQEIGPASQG